MLDNHYPLIKEKYEKYSNLPLEIKDVDNKIYNVIKKLFKSKIKNNVELLEIPIPNEYSSNTNLYNTYSEKIVINNIVSKIKDALEMNNYTNIDSLEFQDVNIEGTNEFIIRLRNKLQIIDFSELIYTSKKRDSRDNVYTILKPILSLLPTKTIRILYKNKREKELNFDKVKDELKEELTKLRFNTRLKFPRGICEYI